MKKYFVSYAQAVALKELGFDENCFATFDSDKWFEVQDFEQNYDTFPSHIIAAPLKVQVFEWFREKYKIQSLIQEYLLNTYMYTIDDGINSDTSVVGFETYEEAESEAIDKLIELLK